MCIVALQVDSHYTHKQSLCILGLSHITCTSITTQEHCKHSIRQLRAYAATDSGGKGRGGTGLLH